MNKITVFTMFLLYVGTSFAQKLPNKQEDSRWTTTKIKVDGKTNDWDDHFSAYNSSAGIFYAFANDDRNLYLIIQAKQPDVINTLVGYGFTLTLQKTDNKNEKDKVVIGYPFFDFQNGNKPLYFNISRSTISKADTGYNSRTAVMNRYNSRIEKSLKYIQVKSINNLDTVSVFNDLGIKASSRFDEHQVYTIELAIPLKLIPNIINDDTLLNYNFNINGSNDFASARQPPAGKSAGYIAGWEAFQAEAAIKYSHSDFWGKYTLAKK